MILAQNHLRRSNGNNSLQCTMLRYTFIILILLVNLNIALSQQSDVQITLSKALEFYENGDLDQSWELLTGVDTPQSELIKVKILTKQASFQQAYERVLPLIKHPLPALREDALFTLAVLQFYRKQVNETLEITFELKKNSKSAVLRRDAANFYFQTIRWLSIEQSDEIIRSTTEQDFKFELFKYHIGKLDLDSAKRYVQINKRWFDKNYASAISDIERYLGSDALFAQYSEGLRSDQFSHHFYKIGIILPDHPKRHELYNVSRSLYGGIQVWMDQFNTNHPNTSFSLSFFRLKPELDNLNELNTWVKTEFIDAVIGPISSNAVKEVSKELSEHSLPIIAPLANDPFLTDGRLNLFQLNPGVKQRAIAFARFTALELQLKNVIIVTDQDSLSGLEADHFIDEFERLGGTIAHNFGDLSKISDNDFRNVLRTLKTEVEPDNSHNLVEALLFVSSNPESKRLFDRTTASLDATGKKISILGTQNLNYITIPSRIKRDYRVYTYSPYDENPIGKSLSDLKTAYKNYVEFETDIYSYIGFDAAALISSLVDFSKNQTTWTYHLNNRPPFRGLAVPIKFDQSRVNSDLYFYRLTSSARERIDFSFSK